MKHVCGYPRLARIDKETKAEAQGDLLDLHAHNVAETLAIQRAAIARASAVEPPKETDAVTRPWKSVSNSRKESGVANVLAGGLLAALMGMGGLGSGAILTWLATQKLLPKPEEQQQQPAEVHPAEYDISLEVKNGKLTPTKVERVEGGE